MNASEIVYEMYQTYRLCNSYRDVGKVTKLIWDPDGSVIGKTETTFSTAFVRNQKFSFRFESYEFDDRDSFVYELASELNTVKVTDSLGRNEHTQSSLLDEIEASCGISHGASYTIPSLLLPDEIPLHILSLASHPRIEGEEGVQGFKCFVLCHDALSSRITYKPIRYFIDKATFMLRRVEKAVSDKDYSAETVTTYCPELNPEIYRESTGPLPP